MPALNHWNKSAALHLVASSPRTGRRAPVPAIDAPESKMLVSFIGLTEAEQRKALAGFPGGKRFVLVRAAG